MQAAAWWDLTKGLLKDTGSKSSEGSMGGRRRWGRRGGEEGGWLIKMKGEDGGVKELMSYTIKSHSHSQHWYFSIVECWIFAREGRVDLSAFPPSAPLCFYIKEKNLDLKRFFLLYSKHDEVHPATQKALCFISLSCKFSPSLMHHTALPVKVWDLFTCLK